MPGIGRRQGGFDHKREIQDRFATKLAEARRSPEVIADQDWSSLDLLLDHIISAITSLA